MEEEKRKIELKLVYIRRSKYKTVSEDFIEGFNAGAEKQLEADRKAVEE